MVSRRSTLGEFVVSIQHTGPLLDISIEQVMKTFDTNVLSIVRMAQAVIPHMAARKSGVVVNIGSIVGEV